MWSRRKFTNEISANRATLYRAICIYGTTDSGVSLPMLRKMGDMKHGVNLNPSPPPQKKKKLRLKMWSTDCKIRGSASFPANYPAQEIYEQDSEPVICPVALRMDGYHFVLLNKRSSSRRIGHISEQSGAKVQLARAELWIVGLRLRAGSHGTLSGISAKSAYGDVRDSEVNVSRKIPDFIFVSGQ